MPEVQDLSFRQAYALLRSLGFTSVEVKYIPAEYTNLAIGVEMNERPVEKGQHVPLNAPLVLIVGSQEMEQDSLALDSLNNLPIEKLDSEVENWF